MISFLLNLIIQYLNKMKKKKETTNVETTDKKLIISDVMVSKTDTKPIKLQLMSLYGKFGKNNKPNFKFY